MEKIEGIKGIIFDYGGTLDSGGDHWSWVIRSAYEKAGVLVSEDSFRGAYVYAERELARVRHILPHHDFADLMGIKIKVELQWLAENSLFPADEVDGKAREVAGYCVDSARRHVEAAKPVLDRLSAKFPMVLVSNFYGNIQAVLEQFGISCYFVKVIESAVVGVRKPDPQIFMLGVRALELDASEVLVVGDSLNKDILPAEAIGCRTAWLKGKGWTPEEDLKEHTSRIGSLSELPELLGC